jgi:hypothetical protein
MQLYSEHTNPHLGQELLGFLEECWDLMQLSSEHYNTHLGQELLGFLAECWGFPQGLSDLGRLVC